MGVATKGLVQRADLARNGPQQQLRHLHAYRHEGWAAHGQDVATPLRAEIRAHEAVSDSADQLAGRVVPKQFGRRRIRS